jgi:hypothetical protein
MKPDDKPAVLPHPSAGLLQSGEALLDVGSWCEEKAKAPLRLSFEIDSRVAACIRLSASVSGLSVHEVARRCIEMLRDRQQEHRNFHRAVFQPYQLEPHRR